MFYIYIYDGLTRHLKLTSGKLEWSKFPFLLLHVDLSSTIVCLSTAINLIRDQLGSDTFSHFNVASAHELDTFLWTSNRKLIVFCLSKSRKCACEQENERVSRSSDLGHKRNSKRPRLARAESLSEGSESTWKLIRAIIESLTCPPKSYCCWIEWIESAVAVKRRHFPRNYISRAQSLCDLKLRVGVWNGVEVRQRYHAAAPSSFRDC